MDISVGTVERALAEEGFPKLPRRTRLKIGLTAKGAEVPQRICFVREEHKRVDGDDAHTDTITHFIGHTSSAFRCSLEMVGNSILPDNLFPVELLLRASLRAIIPVNYPVKRQSRLCIFE